MSTWEFLIVRGDIGIECSMDLNYFPKEPSSLVYLNSEKFKKVSFILKFAMKFICISSSFCFVMSPSLLLFLTLSYPLSLSLFLYLFLSDSIPHSLSLSLSLSHTHTHTLSLSLSLYLVPFHSLSLSCFLAIILYFSIFHHLTHTTHPLSLIQHALKGPDIAQKQEISTE